jgi:hypothetical protein
MKKRILLLALFLAAGAAVFAADNGLSGGLGFYYGTDITKDTVYRKDLCLDLDYGFVNGDTQVKAGLRAETDSILITPAPVVAVREAYVSQDFNLNSFISSINLKAGKMIYTWGNADELKPVDIINGQDYSFLLLKNIQDRKKPVLSGDATVYVNDSVFFELVAIEDFSPDDLQNSSVFKINDIESLNTASVVAPDTGNLAKPHYAARAGISLWDVDSHVIWYDGYDHTPSFDVTFGGGTFPATEQYREAQMMGIDFQRALFSGISVRGEAAYFIKGKYFAFKNTGVMDPAQNPFLKSVLTGSGGFSEKHYADITAGFDATKLFIDKLYMNLEWNGNIMADHSNEMEQDQAVNTLLGTVEYSFWDDRIKPRFKGFYNINDNAFVLGLEAGIKASSNFDITAGVWIFDGKKDSYYGEFRDKDMVYLSGRTEF